MGMSETRINPARKGQSLAMGLIGIGLLILGVVVGMIYLPQAGGAGASGGYTSAIPAVVDFAVPQLSLLDLQGNPVSLSALSGRWVLVNLWATWSPPCKAEMPVLVEYYETHKDQKFVIVAIESGDSPDNVADFMKAYGLTFLVWPDPEQKGLDAFAQEYLPSSYLIDPAGQVRLYWGGPISLEMLEKYVTPRLEEQG